MTAMTASQYREGGMTSEERMVIFASSLGTVFEWYDFYIYGTLAPILAAQFFSGVNPTAAFIFTLLAFAAGFAVRPFGALFFGRLGDLVGRKYTFIITMTLMGVGTFFIGLLPSRLGRHHRADHSDRPPPRARPRARRRIWWRGDLRLRTCAA
jgi:MFS family permease